MAAARQLLLKAANSFPRYLSTTSSCTLVSKQDSFIRNSSTGSIPLRPIITESNSSGALVPVEKSSKELLQTQKKIWEEATSSEEESIEKFVPLTRQELVKSLCNERKLLSHEEREKIETLCAALDGYISQQFYTQLDDMKVCN